MTLTEINKDLFTVPQGYYLAHCISNDFALGAGIAAEFDRVYNMRAKLRTRYGSEPHGNALLVDNVFNLVTKEKCYHKPTYAALRAALMEMRGRMRELSVTKLAVPRIGCGIDRLDWNLVKEMLQEVFADTEADILVCVL